jgi:hypothetical protein
MRRLLVRLALIGFLCRALVPVGFMPAPVADGGPFRLCHGGAAGALVAALLGQASTSFAADDYAHEYAHSDPRHSHHAGVDHAAPDDRQNANHEGWERCPIGAVLAFAVIASDFALPLLTLDHVLAGSDFSASIPRPLSTSYQARAPPHV